MREIRLILSDKKYIMIPANSQGLKLRNKIYYQLIHLYLYSFVH